MPSQARTLTQEQLVSELTERFGPDPWDWAFRCPTCNDIATPKDFRDAGADPGRIGQECIGRHLGALKGAPTRDGGRSLVPRGCDWTAFGLFPGPWTVTMPNGKSTSSFPIAPKSPIASMSHTPAR